MINTVVIGSGPGGYTAAILAARSGHRTVIVEREMLGGTCLNWGCIPTKALISSARFFQALKKSSDMGVDADNVSFDHNKIHDRKEDIVGSIRKNLEKLISSHGIEIIRGEARLEKDRKVSIRSVHGDTTDLAPDNIVIATGSSPIELPFLKPDGKTVLTSRHALSLRELPETMTIIGGGVVGMEFAHYYASLGVEVTVVEALPSILPGFDSQTVRRLLASIRKQGIKIKTGKKLTGARLEDAGVTLEIEGCEPFRVDKVITCIGRQPNLDFLEPDCGIELEGKRIKTDNGLRTAVQGVYAIGDVTSTLMLAHVAHAQAEVAISNINGEGSEFEYSVVPACVFTSLDLACVGVTEDELKDKGIEYRTGTMSYAASSMALATGNSNGYVKLLSDANGVILGAHMFGKGSTEMIHEAAIAMKNEITASSLSHMIHAHPTLSEILMETAADVSGTALHRIYKK